MFESALTAISPVAQLLTGNHPARRPGHCFLASPSSKRILIINSNLSLARSDASVASVSRASAGTARRPMSISLFTPQAVYYGSMAYEIVVHELAIDQLESLRKFDQRRILGDGGYRMNDVPEKELQQNLGSTLTRAQSERIVISRRGKPCAVLVGIEDYDAEDLRLASSEDFWRMIRLRRATGESIPLAQVEARLGITSGKPAGKRAATQESAKALVNPNIPYKKNLPIADERFRRHLEHLAE